MRSVNSVSATATAASSDAFVVERYRRKDEPEVVVLLRSVFDGAGATSFDQRVWRWKHEENPFGESYVLVAREPGGDVIGLRAFMRWAFIRDGRSLRGWRAVDTATHPSFRRMGVFSRLTREALREAAADGVDLIFNTPNANSLPGYLKLGWSYLVEARPVVKVVKPVAFSRRAALELFRRGFSRAADGAESWEGACDLDRSFAVDGLRELLENDQARRATVITPPRTSEYLTWRYRRHPVHDYAATHVSEGRTLLALCVFRRASWAGARAIVIEDLLLRDSRLDLARRVIERLIGEEGPDCLMGFCSAGSPDARLLRRMGFRLPTRRGMNVVVNDVSGRHATSVTDPEEWALSLGDLEFF